MLLDDICHFKIDYIERKKVTSHDLSHVFLLEMLMARKHSRLRDTSSGQSFSRVGARQWRDHPRCRSEVLFIFSIKIVENAQNLALRLLHTVRQSLKKDQIDASISGSNS